MDKLGRNPFSKSVSCSTSGPQTQSPGANHLLPPGFVYNMQPTDLWPRPCYLLPWTHPQTLTPGCSGWQRSDIALREWPQPCATFPTHVCTIRTGVGSSWSGAQGPSPRERGNKGLVREGGGGGSSSEGSIHGIPEWAAAGTNPGHQSGRASSEVRAWLCQGQQCPVVPLFLNSCATHLAEGLRVWEGVWAQPGQEDYSGGRRVYHDGTDARLGRKEGEGPACLRVRVEDGLWALKYVCARTVSGCLSVGTWVPCSHRRLCAPGMSRLSG